MIDIPRPVVDRAGDEVLVPKCRALVRVLGASDDGGDNVFFRYQILAASAAGAVGIVTTEKFQLTPAALPKLAILFKRAGLMDRGEPADDTARFDPADLVGCELVVDVAHHELSRKDGSTYTVSQWPWAAYWAINDPRVADFVRSVSRPQPAVPQPAVPQPAAAAIPDDV